MNCNPQKFSRKEMADFYERLILLWENGDLLNQKFNIRSSKVYRRLKNEHAFEIHALDTIADMTAEYAKFDFSLSQPPGNVIYLHNAKKNILKSYFYHIRNVAGHAHIKKQKVGNAYWYIFDHAYQNQIKLFGAFKSVEFWKVHEELINLRGK
tara:strand:- start:13060 stop:13518 length:459 start_codon:yes stop_codon:yes gene_type:complete